VGEDAATSMRKAVRELKLGTFRTHSENHATELKQPAGYSFSLPSWQMFSHVGNSYSFQ